MPLGIFNRNAAYVCDRVHAAALIPVAEPSAVMEVTPLTSERTAGIAVLRLTASSGSDPNSLK